MTRSTLLNGALCALLLPTLACNLLDVSDSENASGRGAKVFDPYQSSNSGIIRLSLTQYNGCTVLPNGQTVPKNSAIPPEAEYPDACQSPMLIDGFPPPEIADGALQLKADTDYFLNQFTVTDTVVNVHDDPADMAEVVYWIKNQSRFKDLDWSGVGQISDEWDFLAGTPGVAQDQWSRKVLFDNAAWRRVKDDKFTVEILDSEGNVRGLPVDYARAEFMADSPYANHSQFGWQMERVLPPASPGDNTVRKLPEIKGMPPEPPLFRTFARLDLVGSTNPFKALRIPGDLRGPGALRVTWSQMKDKPFYFPVTFVTDQELPATCYDAAGVNRVACGFGIDPNLRFLAPKNGKGYYEQGETLNLYVDLRDEKGNRLHSPDLLPSGNEAVNGKANGLLYTAIPYIERTLEEDMIPVVTVAGPLHKLTPRSNPNDPSPYFGDGYTYAIVEETATTTLQPGEHMQQWSTRYTRTLPANAEAGTYVALIKFHRSFGGERLAKMKPYFFQVGDENGTKETTYPGNVGNCQICHRGVLSLDNLRHGLQVDHVESCKVCHQYETKRGGRFGPMIHKIHSRSPRYPSARNDCTMCHLTRESATRPSLDLCNSCHPSSHGEEYFNAKFGAKVEPNRFGNCAQSCHGETPPQLHILPGN